MQDKTIDTHKRCGASEATEIQTKVAEETESLLKWSNAS